MSWDGQMFKRGDFWKSFASCIGLALVCGGLGGYFGFGHEEATKTAIHRAFNFLGIVAMVMVLWRGLLYRQKR